MKWPCSRCPAMEEARSSRKTCTQRRGDLPTVMEGIRPPRGAIRGARSSRRCHRLRKTRKVAPLQREKQPVTPVVTKLFKTFPEFEVSSRGNKRGGTGSPKPSAR
ncbi:Hypothetical predicted protein [Podarcis lilfordi]|uniref:Uncharacterized protein n=1 Tax=Podarcis lilfordi TaxID=74358 RepID=A0AA35KXC3_9SAUR|nr:Hypothetical predicted protein [Podarcis lilfordi]